MNSKTSSDVLKEFRTLRESDFADPSAGLVRLEALCAEIDTGEDIETWAPTLFSVIERLCDTGHVDLGAPGPIVAALEARYPDYVDMLRASIARKPTSLTVWMADRIMREPECRVEDWTALIESVLADDDASLSARECAADTLEAYREQT